MNKTAWLRTTKAGSEGDETLPWGYEPKLVNSAIVISNSSMSKGFVR